jgi:Putative metal-binding motif
LEERMRKRHWLALAAAAALAAMTGTAWATGTIASIAGPDGTINGCYKAETDKAGQKGELRLVAAGEQCKSNELAIQWNQQGPKGDRGEQGVQGIRGPEGPEGPEGPAGAALIGSSCFVPDGTDRFGGANGTVQMNVAESGAISFTCVVPGGGGGTPSPEVCDGVDNDLDGTIDDGDPGGGGPGANGGIIHCVGGSLVEDLSECQGYLELLNDIDDNCNGQVDEDPWEPYGSDVGVCVSGLRNVATGMTVGVVGPSVEIDNDLDDDCDGTVDNGV